MAKYTAKYMDNYEEWDELVDKSPAGNIFSKSFWLKAVARTVGSDFRILGAFKKHRLVGGVGLNILSLPFRREIVSSPLLTPYNSLVILPRKTNKESKIFSYNNGIIKAISQRMKKDYDAVSLINHPSIDDIRPFQWEGWQDRTKYTYLINIRTPSDLWKEIDGNVRTRVRKCEEKGVEVIKNRDFSSFFGLFHSTFKRRNMISPITQDQLQILFKALDKNGSLQVYYARLNSKIASTMAVVTDSNNEAHEWQAATAPDYLKLGVASFLRWKVINDLSKAGYQTLDLNGAGIESIARAKSQFGSSLVQHYQVNIGKPYIFALRKSWNYLQRWKIIQKLRRKLWQ